MLRWFGRFLGGTVRFAALGRPRERLLNLCAREELPLWETREREGVFYARTTLRGYRRMAKVMRAENRRPKGSGAAVPPPPSAAWWEALVQKDAAQAETEAASVPKAARKAKWAGRWRTFLRFAGAEEREAVPMLPRKSGPLSPEELRQLLEQPGGIRRPAAEKKKPPRKRYTRRPRRRRPRPLERYARMGQQVEQRSARHGRESLVLCVVKREGLRFFLHRYRRRKGMAAGLLLGALFLFGMQFFVWDIEVKGNQTVSDGAVLATLQELGLHVGMPKGELDSNRLTQTLTLRHPEIAWAAVNLLDCRVEVLLQERVFPPEELEKEQPANVVAKEDGVILYTRVKNGRAVVQKGDGVAKGDLLISGVLEDKYGRLVVCHGWGQVMARVEQTITVAVPMEQAVWAPSGGAVTVRELEVLGLRLPLSLPWLGREGTRAESRRPVMLWGLELPRTRGAPVCTPAEGQVRLLSRQEARQQAEAELEKQLRLLFPEGSVLSRDLVGYQREGEYILECLVVCQRDIGVEQPLDWEETAENRTERLE